MAKLSAMSLSGSPERARTLINLTLSLRVVIVYLMLCQSNTLSIFCNRRDVMRFGDHSASVVSKNIEGAFSEINNEIEQ